MAYIQEKCQLENEYTLEKCHWASCTIRPAGSVFPVIDRGALDWPVVFLQDNLQNWALHRQKNEIE